MRPIPIYSTRWLNVFAMCLMLVAGCKKTEPTSDIAAQVSGTYSLKSITTVITPSTTTQPFSVTNGTVVIVRNGASLDRTDLKLSYTSVSPSGSSTFSETKTISLQPSGDAIDLYSGTIKVGNWTTSLLTFTGYPFNNSNVSFTATKQ